MPKIYFVYFFQIELFILKLAENQIMNINRAYPIEKLIDAISYYIEKTNRRVTIEYILLRGLNDKMNLPSIDAEEYRRIY